tara:strand:- start:994 stop:1365 length:372 start_codon:yes stop_codon:yes gene_type:complete
MMLTRSMNKEVKDIIRIFKSSYPQNCNITTMNMHLNKFKNFMQYQQRVKLSPRAFAYLSKQFKWVQSSSYVWMWGNTLGHKVDFENAMCVLGLGLEEDMWVSPGHPTDRFLIENGAGVTLKLE